MRGMPYSVQTNCDEVVYSQEDVCVDGRAVFAPASFGSGCDQRRMGVVTCSSGGGVSAFRHH